MANYHDVLMPSQVKEMERFLRALSKGANLCKQAGVRPNILAAITAWGHIPLTAGEKSITEAFREREKKAKIQREGEVI